MRFVRTCLLAALVYAPVSVSAETFLLMAEETGCPWCARWDKEISHIYPKTDEGRAAPLRRYDLHAGSPEDVTFERPVHFTPTFVLVVNGVEKGRIEGYPGEDFFWPLLSALMDRARIERGAAG